MSPASSGTLEVEKYIGACLISQQRPKGYSRVPDVYPGNYYMIQRCNSGDGWAGGLPLISFANHQKRNRPEGASGKNEEHTPLARLAVHTQGAPLILTKNFRRKKKNFEKKRGVDQNSVVDTVSVTSDESSGSANSDQCLPRIIKPRKRRKKDRKPVLISNTDGFSTDSASPDILRNYTPFVFDRYDPHIYGLVPELLLSKPLKEDNNESEIQLHHSFDDIEDLEDVDINGNQTVCQCRYCDPSGQIWDVDRSCYSPFLTSPRDTLQLQNLDSFLSNYSNDVDHCLVHTMSSVSLEDEKSELKNPPISSGDLEVSTEIVTSLNGHRDIEIRFFSSSSVDSVRALPKGSDRNLTSDDCVNKECKVVLEE